MRLAEIHGSVRVVLGRDVDRAALKNALSANILRARPKFRRIRRGVYDVL
jgi:hypothetical protein